MLRNDAFLAALRSRRAASLQRRFNEGSVCYFASHVLLGWEQQGDGGRRDVAELARGIAADLVAGRDDAMRRCAAVMVVEWEESGLPSARKVRLAASDTVRRRCADRGYLQRVFRGMDAAFDDLYRVRRGQHGWSGGVF